MIKPEPLEQDLLDTYSAYLTEHDVLFEKKQKLNDKLAKIILQIEHLEKESLAHKWSHRNNNKDVIKRLNSEIEEVKKEIVIVEKDIEKLRIKNNTLHTLINIHDSRVKGYEEYLIWKEVTTRHIYEALVETE